MGNPARLSEQGPDGPEPGMLAVHALADRNSQKLVGLLVFRPESPGHPGGLSAHPFSMPLHLQPYAYLCLSSSSPRTGSHSHQHHTERAEPAGAGGLPEAAEPMEVGQHGPGEPLAEQEADRAAAVAEADSRAAEAAEEPGLEQVDMADGPAWAEVEAATAEQAAEVDDNHLECLPEAAARAAVEPEVSAEELWAAARLEELEAGTEIQGLPAAA
mgnify:CR=1 FL=1